MRVVSLYKFTHSDNITRDLPELVIWGGLELYVAIVCACLPSLRPLLTLAASRFKSWTTRGSQSTDAPSTGPSKDWIRSRSKRKIPSEDGHDLEYTETGTRDTRTTSIWRTTTIQQQRLGDPATESETNLTDVELQDRQKGATQVKVWE